MIAPAAAKALRKLPRNERERILVAIQRLPAGDVRSLKGRRGEWRLPLVTGEPSSVWIKTRA